MRYMLYFGSEKLPSFHAVIIIIVLCAFNSTRVNAASADETIDAIPYDFTTSEERENTWTLEALLKAGAHGNPRVASSINTLSAAEDNKSAAWQEYLPSPSIQFQQDPNGKEETALVLTQPIWSGGRIESGVDRTSANESAASANIAVTRYDLALAIINSFQQFVQSRGRQIALTRFSERLGIYRTRMNNRVATGASPANDSELLDARMATNAAQLRAAQESERVALAQLSQMTGLVLKKEDLVIISNDKPIQPLSDLISQAEQHNPKLRVLAYNIAAAEAVVKEQRSVVMPTVSLVLKHTMVHGSSVNGNNGDDSSASFQVSMAPGAGLSAFSRIKAAQSEVYALRDTRNATSQELQVQIQSDYEKVSSATARHQDAMINAKSAAGVLSSYERLFVAGKRGWMDVMNAARDLSDADIVVADTDAELFGARYRLDVYAIKYSFLNETTNITGPSSAQIYDPETEQ